MAGSDGGKTQIMVAFIGVTGVLGAALIANWEKIFGPEPPRTEIVKGEKAPPGTVPPAVASKIGNAGIPDISGIWHDQLGQTYAYVQSGADYTYSWSRNGVPLGSGSGRLEGRKFTGRFQYANGASGTCAGDIEGDRAVMACLAGGQSFPMTLTR
jgi:hypothetical protein